MTNYTIKELEAGEMVKNGCPVKYILTGKRGAKYSVIQTDKEGYFLSILNSQGFYCSLQGNSAVVADQNGKLSLVNPTYWIGKNIKSTSQISPTIH